MRQIIYLDHQDHIATIRDKTAAPLVVMTARERIDDRLMALGVTNAEIQRLEKEREASQRVRVYAQSDGVIAHLGVREGIFVTPATEVMSVARLDRVWVLAEVFELQEQALAVVGPGQASEIVQREVFGPVVTVQSAADEEIDHLAWCEERLQELDARPSLLNPLWYAGSFAIGALAGIAGDDWSLGFVKETENQVEVIMG